MDSIVDILEMRQHSTDIAFTELARGGKEVASLSFGELFRGAAAIAVRLQGEGLAGQSVLLLLANGLDFIVAFYGCLMAGCVAVPQKLPKQAELARFRDIQRTTGAQVVLTTA